MKNHNHEVVTRDYPENLTGGIMVCGYNFGFSVEDESSELAGVCAEPEAKSFFSNASVNDTRFRNKLVSWMHSWGIPLETEESKATSFERSIWQTNWINTQTRTIADDKITVNSLVENSGSILELIEERKPRVILFTGSLLIEALNDIRIRDEVERILGDRPGNAEIHYSETPTTGTRFKVLTQMFPQAAVVSLPHATGSIGLADDYMAGFRQLMEKLLIT